MGIENPKVSIIGAGSIGAQTAYTLTQADIVSEIVIVNRDETKARGKAMDISHGAALFGNTRIRNGNYEDTRGSHIVVITAGQLPDKNGTRFDVLKSNVEIYRPIISGIEKYNKDCTIVLVTNPVDILAYAAYKLSSFPSNRIIGTGTLLDSSRLKYFIGDYYDINPGEVETCVVGEHGDSQVVLWSNTTIKGVPITDYIGKNPHKDFNEETKSFLENKTKRAGWDIRACNQHSCFGISICLFKIIEAIIRDEKIILPVSTFFKGEYGISGIFMGMPAILGKNGVEEIIKLSLSSTEVKLLQSSSEYIKEYTDTVDSLIAKFTF